MNYYILTLRLRNSKQDLLNRHLGPYNLKWANPIKGSVQNVLLKISWINRCIKEFPLFIIWVAFAAHMKSSEAIDDIILTTAPAKDGVYVLGRKTKTLNCFPKPPENLFHKIFGESFQRNLQQDPPNGLSNTGSKGGLPYLFSWGSVCKVLFSFSKQNDPRRRCQTDSRGCVDFNASVPL